MPRHYRFQPVGWLRYLRVTAAKDAPKHPFEVRMVGRVDDGVHAAVQDADGRPVESERTTGWHGKGDEIRRDQEEEDAEDQEEVLGDGKLLTADSAPGSSRHVTRGYLSGLSRDGKTDI